MKRRFCLSAALMAFIGVAALASPARAQFTVNLTSNTGVGSIPNIGGTLSITSSASLLGSGTDPNLALVAFYPDIVSGNATISGVVGLGLFSVLPPPNPGDIVAFANPAAPGQGPFELVSYILTRTGPGDIVVNYSAVPGLPVQGNGCALNFTGGGFTVVPSPATASLLALCGLTGLRRRRW